MENQVQFMSHVFHFPDLQLLEQFPIADIPITEAFIKVQGQVGNVLVGLFALHSSFFSVIRSEANLLALVLASKVVFIAL